MRRKIIISLFALFLFFATGSAIETVYIAKSTSELSRLIKLHQVENLRRALVISIQSVQSDLYTVHTPLGRKLDSIVQNVSQLEESAKECSLCHHPPELINRIQEMQGLIQEYQIELSHYITASANAQRIEQLKRKAALLGNEIILFAEDMSFTASNKLGEMTNKAMMQIKHVRFIIFVTLASVFVLGLLVSFNLAKSITKPVHELVDATRAITAGSLGHQISYHDKTEFGELAEHFNAMSTAMKEGYVKLKAANEKLRKEIIERIRAEEKIENAYNMTRHILEKSPFGIFVVDSTGMVEYVNPAMSNISGEHPSQFIGSNIFETPSYSESGVADKIRDALKGEPFFLGPVKYTSSDGMVSTVRNIIGMPFGDDKKGTALIFVEDVTERVKLEEQLRHAQKMDALGTLTGGLAHEFNNIITAIIGSAELFLEDVEDDSLRDYPEMILSSAKRAAILTQGLLTYSRKQVIHRQVLALNEIITRFKGIVSGIIGEDIAVSIDLPDEEVVIKADGSQIEQVLMNLVTNARDAMPRGGDLSIRVELLDLDDEFIKVHGYGSSGSYVCTSVQDSGEGMTEDIMERIFEPFFTTKDVGKGTGLGLSMVYGIVREHDGYIDVESSPGMGTTFRLYLPVSDEEYTKTEEGIVSSLKGGRETILLAEDDRGVRAMLKALLEKAGYTVIEAVDGDDAVNKFTDNKGIIDLLLSDVIMPKKNGKEAFNEIVKVDPDIKALFISGYSDKVLLDKGIVSKGIKIIEKPLLREEILQSIRNELDGKLVKKA